MNLIIEPPSGESFTLDAHNFSITIEEIKLFIESKLRIPVSKQTLVFNGGIFPNNRILSSFNFKDNSRIKLVISEASSSSSLPVHDNDEDTEDLSDIIFLPDLFEDNDDKNTLMTADWPPPPLDKAAKLVASSRHPHLLEEAAEEGLTSSYSFTQKATDEVSPSLPADPKGKAPASSSAPPNTSVRLLIKIHTPQTHVVSVEMDVNDTIGDLKNKILEAERTNRTVTNQSLSSTVLTLRSQQELQETHSLREYELSDGAEINVTFRLRVHVMSACKTMRSHVDVNADDELLALRTECQRLNRESNFPLPVDGRYFFIHKGVAMQEERSFRSHDVEEGNTIFLVEQPVTRRRR